MFVLMLVMVSLTGCAGNDGGYQAELQEADVHEQEAITYVFHDDMGREVSVDSPKRVAALLGSYADIWYLAGGEICASADDAWEDFDLPLPEDAVNLGMTKELSLEKLFQADPDFVLASSNTKGNVEWMDTLEAAGIPVAYFEVSDFEDYLRVLKICTDILGTPDRYAQYGTALKAEIDSLIASAQARENQPDILFVRAGSSAKYTKAKTAENHFVCGMLKDLGTFNIAEKAPVLLDGLSTEEILLSDPDFILFTTMGDEKAGQVYMESLISDPVWQTLTAVQAGRVHQLPKDLFQYKPNALWGEAYAYLIQLLYG
jgi:iron complex transport system substrate-binding protein